ncbi:MAG: SulP family sulfate permease [Roseivirga sp.]
MAVLGRIKGFTEYRNLKRFDDLESWSHLLVIRIDAPFVFVNIQTIKDRILNEALQREGKLKRVIIDAGPVSYIDATAIDGIRELIETLRTKGIELLFTEVIGPVRDVFYRNNLFSEKASDTFFLTTDEAVNYCLSVENKNDHVSFAVQASKLM